MSRLGRRLPLPSLHWPTVRHPARVRAAAALGLIAACALLVIAVIGETEGSAPSSGLQQANVVGSAPQEQTSELERARSATDALLGRKTAPKAKRNHAVKRHANGKRSRIHATPTHHRRPNHRKKQPTHRASAPTHTTSEVVQTTTTYTPTTTSTASQTPVTSNPSAGEAASSSSGSGNARQPAFGLNGSLGPGRSPDS